MAFDRFLIAPLSTGLQKNVRPWIIMDDAFEFLQNAYVWRGRLKKRFGSRLMGSGWSSSLTEPLFSRLRINLGNTDGSGTIATTVPGSKFKVGQQFSIANEIFTVVVTGSPGVMLTTGSSTVHTYNTTNGAVVINGAAAATPVWFYPAEPVMGFITYTFGSLNNQYSYAYDTQFAYIFSGGFWQRSGDTITPQAIQLHGTDINFVWSCNWTAITAGFFPSIFATNFYIVNPNGLGTLTDDPIWSTRTLATQVNVIWVPFSYSPSAAINPLNVQPTTITRTTDATGTIVASYVQSARLVVPFKDRLLLLNTIENDANGATAWSSGMPTTTGITPANYVTSNNTQYVNRCRFSHNGSPYSHVAWLEPNQVHNFDGTGVAVADGGGFIDAPTEESIVSCEFIKDRLIVYFEGSTWELAYTGNQVLPFVWQKLNTELGAESQNSVVPFDKVILGVSTVGITACNGSNVQEIDDKIPDEVYNIRQESLGIARISSIRDYFADLVYWAYPVNAQNSSQVYPTQVLVYNYLNDSWGINNDTITSFGYFEQQPNLTWATWNTTWEQSNWTWSSASSTTANFRQVIGGNQQGYVFICDTEESRNARNLQITNIVTSGTGVNVTIINHNLQTTNVNSPRTGDFVAIENTQGATLSGAGVYPFRYVDVNTIFINNVTLTGTYTGGGTASRVSNLYIRSKQWNPYIDKGFNLFLSKIEFGVLKTEDGQVTVDYYPSQTELSMLDQGGVLGTDSLMSNGILETSPYNAAFYPLEQEQNMLWHPIYFQSSGETIQILIHMSVDQMGIPQIAFSDFELDGMVLHTKKMSSRLQ